MITHMKPIYLFLILALLLSSCTKTPVPATQMAQVATDTQIPPILATLQHTSVPTLSPTIAPTPIATFTRASTKQTPPPIQTTTIIITPPLNVTFDAQKFLAFDQLKSFRQETKLTHKGTCEDGSTLEQASEALMEVVNQTESQYIRINTPGFPDTGSESLATKPNVSVEYYVVGNQVYTTITGSWLVRDYKLINEIENDINLLLAWLDDLQNDLLGRIWFINATHGWLNAPTYVETTIYNGVQAHHFIFNENNLNQSELGENVIIENANGNLYTAVEGGYLIHLDFTFNGTNLSGVRGAESKLHKGTITIIVDQTMIDQIPEIKIPKAVVEESQPPAELDTLITDDAEIAMMGFLQAPGINNPQNSTIPNYVIAYLSGQPQANVSAWYQSELTKLGWKKTKIESFSHPGFSGDLLEFEKSIPGVPAQTINLEISITMPDQPGGRTKVTISCHYLIPE